MNIKSNNNGKESISFNNIENEEDDNNYLYIKMIKEEEEEKDLQKFIECFNYSSLDKTLNSSFEELSQKCEDNYFGYYIVS